MRKKKKLYEGELETGTSEMLDNRYYIVLVIFRTGPSAAALPALSVVMPLVLLFIMF